MAQSHTGTPSALHAPCQDCQSPEKSAVGTPFAAASPVPIDAAEAKKKIVKIVSTGLAYTGALRYCIDR